jgi:hypothetical protein
MSGKYHEEILKIKQSSEYLNLKNKTRTNQDNQKYQKILRRIKTLELQDSSQHQQPKTITVQTQHKVQPQNKVVKRPNKRNQHKVIGWRNQEKWASDEEYEKAYAARFKKYEETGKFSQESIKSRNHITQPQPLPSRPPVQKRIHSTPTPPKPVAKPVAVHISKPVAVYKPVPVVAPAPIKKSVTKPKTVKKSKAKPKAVKKSKPKPEPEPVVSDNEFDIPSDIDEFDNIDDFEDLAL